MRGEQPVLHLPGDDYTGSPPHARGAVSLQHKNKGGAGITPACAGSREDFRPSSRGFWDHPRMRGEQFQLFIQHGGGIGSPPHARGAAMGQLDDAVLPGITPACAGSRRTQSPVRYFAQDHPRMRGEQPPMYLNRLPLPGITPACAGSRLKKYRVIKDSSYSSIKFPLTSDRSHM